MIIGHQKQLEYLQKMLKSQKLPHALLFCGQEHLGKKTLALKFLKEILGQDFLSHPDFIFVEPSEKEIQIFQIRDLNWRLALKPFSANVKVALIDKAHLMNHEAQNCFLKTLEEPRGRAFIILISEYPERLLPTIKSRVQSIRFSPVPRKEMENYLNHQKMTEKEKNVLLEVSQGRPGIAVDFFSNPGKLADFKKRLKDISLVLDANLGRRLQYAKNLSQEDDAIGVLCIWQNLFRNVMLSKLGVQKKWIVLKKEYSLEKIGVILKNIQTILFLISTTNASKRLALETLMIEL